MVSTRPLNSNSSSPFNDPLVTVPKAPITIGIIFTFMFHIFFSIPSQSPGTYPSFHFPSVLFCGQPGQQSGQFCKFSFLLLIIFWPRFGDPLVCQIPKRICVSFSKTDIGLCIYHLLVWSNLNVLHISLWITLTTHSCLVLYSLCANLLHLLIM